MEHIKELLLNPGIQEMIFFVITAIVGTTAITGVKMKNRNRNEESENTPENTKPRRRKRNRRRNNNV